MEVQAWEHSDLADSSIWIYMKGSLLWPPSSAICLGRMLLATREKINLSKRGLVED